MRSLRSRFDPLRRLGPRAAVLLVVALLTTAELALRAHGYGNGLVASRDQDLGWVHLPHQDVVQGGVRLRTNALGFRDDEWTRPAGPGQPVSAGGRHGLRVLVLGDSVTHASRLREEERWTELLEQRLRERDEARGIARDVLVMNASVPGYCLEQMLELYRLRLREWRPHLVLVTVNVGSARPALPAPDDYGPLQRMLVRTALYDFWLEKVVGFGTLGRRPPRDELERRAYETVDRAVEAPFAKDNLALWDRLETDLVALRNDVGPRGGRVAAVAMPRLHELLSPLEMSVARRLQGWCRRRRFPLCDPSERFARELAPLLAEVRARGLAPEAVWPKTPGEVPTLREDAHNLYFHDDPAHWTARAHQLLAEEVATCLDRAGLLDPPAEK